MRRTKKSTMLWALAVPAIAVVAVLAWRWMPRATVPATAQMRAAMQYVTAQAASVATKAPVAPARPKTDRERLLAAAFSLRGVPYKWGSKGPDTYDCSGFTKAAYKAGSVALPDGSFNQAKGEQPMKDPEALAPGDLLLYRWAGQDAVKHVTLYAGDGWVIGTGSPGQPAEVTLYPLASDLLNDGRVITYRHIRLPDER